MALGWGGFVSKDDCELQAVERVRLFRLYHLYFNFGHGIAAQVLQGALYDADDKALKDAHGIRELGAVGSVRRQPGQEAELVVD